MPLEIQQKLTVRKVLLAIIGGLITITMFRYTLSLAIESRYGIDTDIVVVSINQKPDKDLIDKLCLKAEEYYVIGDCREVRKMRDSIAEGEKVSRWI